MQSTKSATAPYQIYIKRQGTEDFNFVPTNNFVFVPNLNEAFHVTKNTLFKITFQGSLWNGPNVIHQFIQIMVNDNLIIGDKILPNTAHRVNFGIGNDLQAVDTNAGMYHSQVGGIMMLITREAFVYLPPGTWSFNVGVRSMQSQGWVRGGVVTYELTELINENVGGMTLADLPK